MEGSNGIEVAARGAGETFVFTDTHADSAAGILVAWAAHLASLGHRIVFAHPPPESSSALVSRFAAFGAMTAEVAGLPRAPAPALAWALDALIKKLGLRRPILVACESVPMRAHSILAMRRGYKALHHVLLLRTGPGARSRMRELVDSFLVRRSHTTILGCSRGVCEHWAERLGVPWEQVVYMPNWVDSEKFHPALGEAIATGTPMVTSVAAFRPVKLQDILIRAMAILRDRGIAVHAQFVGAPDRPGQHAYFRECECLIRELDLESRVRFLGRRSDIDEILRHSTCFAFPSRQEGLSCALLEAMASGIPVIASAIHASFEVITHGYNGFLVPVGDPAAMAEAIETAITLPPELRHSMGCAARDTILRNYTLHRATGFATDALRKRGIHV